MADEPLGMCPGEDDGTDARIAVDPVHQLVQLLGDIEAEQLVRAAVDPDDKDGSAVLDLQMTLVFVWHGFCSRAEFMGECKASEGGATGARNLGQCVKARPERRARVRNGTSLEMCTIAVTSYITKLFQECQWWRRERHGRAAEAR
ncbi:hypothetical protein SGFS_010170 [Streptomyces graminofaciens]|uniref:Uncharacterized protein n=1 Tax=Streptomyces graminofaciens TaxID=68212 RepID=A0ABN5V8W4_9ACTN|nr:hypothetical protein SGFS_010170 [Streptomyces graminofaciens]